uniref:Protein PTHB1 n=1 Tax=Meloidogyne javanica TaxID=6303 RepID=A0A915N8I2_MELJA
MNSFYFEFNKLMAFSRAIVLDVDSKDQIIVGSLDGILTVFDPGREPNHQNEMGVLSTLQISRSILQLSTGYFLPSYGPETLIIVALTPSTLIYFKINQNRYFGRSNVEQICVQSLQGGLILYEAENRVLQRSIPDILHPGPLGSVRYSTLIATGTKQTYIDWTIPLGDWAVQMVILLGDPSASLNSRPSSAIFNSNTNLNSSISINTNAQNTTGFPPSIIVLCKRILYCFTHNGSKSSENKLIQQQTTLPISIIIGTAGKTLLFYSDTKLIWNVQLPFAAQIVETCTFSDSLRSMIVLLSENSDKLLVGYLGTEPSLFKMPASETREYNLIELFIPLFLICREVPPQRQAIFKLSIDSTQPALDIDILFPEFSNQKEEIGKEISNQNSLVEGKRTSIALQPFFGESTTSVSLFISTKTNRYRIQSDNTDFVFVIFSVLIERIQKNQPEARLHCPVPLHLCLTEIAKYIEAEEECANLEKQASILATQIRQVETVFLSRLKASQNENIMENYERMPVESLVEYSHK